MTLLSIAFIALSFFIIWNAGKQSKTMKKLQDSKKQLKDFANSTPNPNDDK